MNIRKLFHYTFGPIGAGIFGILTLPILTWFFQKEEIGRFAYLQLLISLGMMFGSLGLHQALVREYYEYNDKFVLLKTILIDCLKIFLISIPIIYFLQTNFSLDEYLFELKNPFLIFLLSMIWFISIYNNIINHYIRMEEKSVLFSLGIFFPKFSFLILVIISVFLFQNKNFNSLIILTLLSNILVTILFSMNLIEDNKKIISSVYDKSLSRKLLNFSIPLMFADLAYWGINTLDRVFIKHFLGFEELGVYSVAVMLATSINIITSIFASIWHPLIYKWSIEGINEKKIQEIIDLVSVIIFLIWSLIGVLVYVIKLVLPINYYEVQYLIMGCIASPLLYLLSETTSIGIGLSRRSRYQLYAMLFSILFNLILNFILINFIGLKGAAISVLLTSIFLYLTKSEISKKLLEIHLNLKKSYCIVVIYAIYSIYFVFYQPNSIFYYFIWLVLIIIVYIIYIPTFKNIFRFSANLLKKRV